MVTRFFQPATGIGTLTFSMLGSRVNTGFVSCSFFSYSFWRCKLCLALSSSMLFTLALFFDALQITPFTFSFSDTPDHILSRDPNSSLIKSDSFRSIFYRSGLIVIAVSASSLLSTATSFVVAPYFPLTSYSCYSSLPP